jgi:hypothetical protein
MRPFGRVSRHDDRARWAGWPIGSTARATAWLRRSARSMVLAPLLCTEHSTHINAPVRSTTVRTAVPLGTCRMNNHELGGSSHRERQTTKYSINNAWASDAFHFDPPRIHARVKSRSCTSVRWNFFSKPKSLRTWWGLLYTFKIEYVAEWTSRSLCCCPIKINKLALRDA